MKITPVVQNGKNQNFKGASTISKYGDDVQNAIKIAIESSFQNIFAEADKVNKEPNKIIKFINDIDFVKKTKEYANKGYEQIIKGIAWVIGKASNTETSKNLVNKLNKFKKPSARMADLASFAITFFYVNNTRKSKKIEEERKMPLMINNITVTAVSSTMAALIDKGSDVVLDRVKGALCLQKGKEVLDNVITSMPDIANKIEGKNIEELSEDILRSREFRTKIKEYTKNFNKAKSLTVFAITVRFLVTVLMVPVAGKIVKLVKEKTKHQALTENTQANGTDEQKMQKSQINNNEDNDEHDDDDD